MLTKELRPQTRLVGRIVVADGFVSVLTMVHPVSEAFFDGFIMVAFPFHLFEQEKLTGKQRRGSKAYTVLAFKILTSRILTMLLVAKDNHVTHNQPSKKC